jgi:hypothetical protein
MGMLRQAHVLKRIVFLLQLHACRVNSPDCVSPLSPLARVLTIQSHLTGSRRVADRTSGSAVSVLMYLCAIPSITACVGHVMATSLVEVMGRNVLSLILVTVAEAAATMVTVEVEWRGERPSSTLGGGDV